VRWAIGNPSYFAGHFLLAPIMLVYTNLETLHSDNSWRVAIHEAGHAIAGVRLEQPFDRVRVGDNEFGEVEWTHDPFDPLSEPNSLECIRSWQTIYAAGAAAEQTYFGEIRRHSIRRDQICHLRMDMLREEGVVDLFENAIERAFGLMKVAELKAVGEKLIAQLNLPEDKVARLIDYTPPWAR